MKEMVDSFGLEPKSDWVQASRSPVKLRTLGITVVLQMSLAKKVVYFLTSPTGPYILGTAQRAVHAPTG